MQCKFASNVVPCRKLKITPSSIPKIFPEGPSVSLSPTQYSDIFQLPLKKKILPAKQQSLITLPRTVE